MNRNFDQATLRPILAQFDIPGNLILVEPFGNGHINRTFASIHSQAGTRVRYIHQRINEQVFQRPDLLMDNIERVLRHQMAKILASGQPEPDRRSMRLIYGRDGRPFVQDSQGGYWRTYLFVEHTRSCDVLESDDQAANIARVIGRFQHMVADLPGPRLHETIPNFHNARTRYRTFHEVVAADPCQRVAAMRPEIEWFLANEDRTCAIVRAMEAKTVPERITHNDTKANNILLDDITGEGICVIDLDTVMPGSLLYDFGDMVRTATGTAAEDEPDATKMTMRLSRFRALVGGFAAETADIMTPGERELLPEAGRIITTIIGLRFITDYLGGDTYFRIHRPDHNRDRLRTQIALVESMDRQMAEIRAACAAAVDG